MNLNQEELSILICALNYLSEPNPVYQQMSSTQINRLYNKLYSKWEEYNEQEKMIVGNHVG